jgi:hypothetical protein
MAETRKSGETGAPPRARRGGMQRLGAAVPRLAGPVLGRQGLGEAQLLGEWPAIVGPALADQCWPVKLAFPRGERKDGTLRLRAAPAAALEIQHKEPAVIERINAFFGYRAVARLALVQGPLPRRAESRPPPPRPLDSGEDDALKRRLAGVADPALQAALERLGRAVIGSN